MKITPAILCLFFQLLSPILLSGQPEVFRLDDFELRGPVESCTVITDYGEERFEFDREGKLTKSLTRYNDSDYDISYYRYQGGALVEKRDEVYRGGAFDESTSFARFYRRDSLTGMNLVEKITSYDQSILEQITYSYDTIGRLQEISRVHQQGIDQTKVVYSTYKEEETAEYLLNEQLTKSIRTSFKESKKGPLEVRLVKEYYQEMPQSAVEQTRDSSNQLLSEVKFIYDSEKQRYKKSETHLYSYNEAGFLEGEKVLYYRQQGSKSVVYRTEEKTLVYQQDGQTPGNWIRKIITPENSFTNRRITYFSEASDPEREGEPDKG